MSVPQFVTLLPDNQIGKECARTLRYHGVDTSCLHFKKGRMGIYFLKTARLSGRRISFMTARGR